MRKLVLLDEDGWLTEVDPKALRREALELKEYIDNAPLIEEQQFHYKTKLLPLVNSALDGFLKIPYKDEPYNIRLIIDGLELDLPLGIQDLYFRFLTRIKGAPPAYPPNTLVGEDGRFVPDKTDANGKRYRWVEFED